MLKDIFYEQAQSLNLSRSLLSYDAEIFLFLITEKSDKSSAKSFTMDGIPSIKSFI